MISPDVVNVKFVTVLIMEIMVILRFDVTQATLDNNRCRNGLYNHDTSICSLHINKNDTWNRYSGQKQ